MILSTVLALGLLAASNVVHAIPLANDTLHDRASLAQVITRCTVPNTAALTFDDGPYVYLYVRSFSHFSCRSITTLPIKDISKALIAAGAKGTFFFNGNNCEHPISLTEPRLTS